MKTIALTAALVLAGCTGAPLTMPFAQSAPESTPVPAPVIKTVVKQKCIPWHEWSVADLAALKVALKPIPESSVITRMALDWNRYYRDAHSCTLAR